MTQDLKTLQPPLASNRSLCRDHLSRSSFHSRLRTYSCGSRKSHHLLPESRCPAFACCLSVISCLYASHFCRYCGLRRRLVLIAPLLGFTECLAVYYESNFVPKRCQHLLRILSIGYPDLCLLGASPCASKALAQIAYGCPATGARYFRCLCQLVAIFAH